MAEKIRPAHLPPTTVPSQQTLLVASQPSDAAQHMMPIPKLQQVPSLQAHNSTQPDVALHARPASSSVPGTEHDVWHFDILSVQWVCGFRTQNLWCVGAI